MVDLLITLVSVLGGAVLGFAMLVWTGQLVPGSRLALAEQAARLHKEAYDTLKIPVEKFGLMTDLTGAVIRATQAAAVSPSTGSHLQGG